MKHIQYIQKLNKKQIKVFPMENYKGSKTKIQHKCICNNIWDITPAHVLTGTKCGCTKGDKLTLKHEDYINKLKAKNIDVMPLENYTKNAQTKILHECICGNKWNIAPYKVLQGQKCGCRRINSHDMYIKTLINKNILVVPLEKWKDTKTKILHKCTCGNKFNIMPQGVLNGNKCGCEKEKTEIEKYKDRKTILYYIKVNELWKIGICLYGKDLKSSILKGRFGQDIKKGVSIEILKTKVFEDGSEAYIKEQNILDKFKKYQYLGEDMKWFGGHTELFYKNIKEINV